MSDHENLLLKLRRGFRVQPNATKTGEFVLNDPAGALPDDHRAGA